MKKRILVVEDDNIIGMEIRDRVENLGYEVSELLSYGEHAIAKVSAIMPDLILMDIRLKGDIDGIDAAETIRKKYDIPVVYLTAYADDNTLKRAKITEPFGYVLKPFEERDLASTIEMAIYKHQMDKKIRTNERWLATTLRSLGDGVIAIDKQGQVDFMNPVAQQLTGWEMGKARTKKFENIFKIIDNENRRPIDNPIKQVLSSKKSVELSENTLLVSKQKIERPVLGIFSPIISDNGDVSGIVVVFQDNTERKRSREVLELQSRYNELRATLWKIAADKTLGEEDLISRMNQCLGPVLGVSRVSYNKLYGNYLDEGEFKCILEWCADGISSSLGAALPAKIANPLLKFKMTALDRQKIMDTLPKALHAIAAPVISVFEKKYDIESILMVPFYVDKTLEGIISFDVCKSQKNKPEWTKEAKTLIAEAVDIVSNFIIQKRSESALRISEERFRTIIEAVPDLIYIKDRFLTYTHVNPAVEKLFDKTAVEIIGLSDDELFGFKVVTKNSKDNDLRVLKGEIVSEEAYGIFSGRTITFEVVKVPLRDHKGAIVGICGVARDISERKKSEKIQKVLFEISNAVIMTQDLYGLFKSMKETLGQVVDTTNFFIALYNEETKMLSLPYFVDEKDKFTEMPVGKTLTSYVIKHKKTMHVRENEIYDLVKAKEIEIVGTVPKVWLGVPLRSGDKVVGVIVVQNYENASIYTEEHSGILEFVSGQIAMAIERKQAELERIRLATAIQFAAEAILITDEVPRIQYVNPAFESITGYRAEDVLGKNPSMLSSGKQGEAFYHQFWDIISSGKTWMGQFVNRKQNGSFYEASATVSPIFDESGKIVNYVAVTRDVTKQHQLEMRLRQAEKMEAIGTLAGGIAHDFNNIIGAIIGYAELSLDDVKDELLLRNLNQIIKASHRAKDLVQQILAFSRQGKQDRKPLQMSLIVNEALKLIRATLPTTIDIRTNIEAKTSLVFADPTNIHQIIMNLCANAAHSMRERGGVLEVSLKDIQVESDMVKQFQELKPGGYVKLMVKDSGNGIDSSIVDRIFDPYFTTKKVGEGAGMGLALVHGIIKAYQGEITVYSEPGRGTTFNVFLPRIVSKAKKEAKRAKSLPRGSETILYVDDEENLVNVGSQVMERLGYKVVSTSSSQKAWELFQATPEKFDLVITDQTMPEMTGAELAKKLMGLRPDVRIILCTGFSEIISKEKAKEMGIREFVMKPLFSEELANVIRKVLDN
ncbi:MAG TPA: PAS domain S-box protein [bacterium]|nr:PAS domain S-box protein [bacterium]